MREILFRGKVDSDAYSYDRKSEWVYGDYYNCSILYPNRSSILTKQDAYPVLTETVGQYIGLNDAEGTKIFEGDIIEFEDCGSEGYEYEEGFDYVNRASVAISEGRVILDKILCDNSGVCDDMLYYYDDFISMLKHCKVIGNIWDDISLLQKERVSSDNEEDM